MAQTTWRGYTLKDRAQSMGVSPDEQLESERSGATRVYDIDWSSPNVLAPVSQRQQIIKQILGYPRVLESPITGAKYLSRVTPHFDYAWKRTTDAKPFMYATKVRTQGVGPCPNRATYQDLGAFRDGTHTDPIYNQCRLTVQYESLPWEIKDDSEVTAQIAVGGVSAPDESGWERYVQKIVKPAGEFFTLPANAMKQVGGGNTFVEFGVGKLLSFYNLQVTWYQVPESAVPCKAINSGFAEANCIEGIIGKVNNDIFNGYSDGQLLLLAAELRPYRSPFGDRIYDITYMFKFFQNTHQKIFRCPPQATTAGWYEIVTSGPPASGATNLIIQAASGSIYDWANFKLLFRHGS